MIIKEEQWQHIPLLHIVDERYEYHDLPVVIFLHGFTSAKEHNLHYAYNMAQQGIRVLLPEAHLHGVRAEKLDSVELALRFWEIVLTSIDELAIIHSELKVRNIVQDASIGVGGSSMGAITTMGALTKYEWISAAASMMGTPGYVNLAHEQIERFLADGFEIPLPKEEMKSLFATLAFFDLTRQQEVLGKRPLYFWHGQRDHVVPFAPTYTFYEQLVAKYGNDSGQFQFTQDETAGHSVTRKGVLEVTKWFASHLNR